MVNDPIVHQPTKIPANTSGNLTRLSTTGIRFIEPGASSTIYDRENTPKRVRSHRVTLGAVEFCMIFHWLS